MLRLVAIILVASMLSGCFVAIAPARSKSCSPVFFVKINPNHL